MRDHRLDWIKGFLIVCVVLGHTMRVGSCASGLDLVVLRGIYGFHMPLFVLLCGYFFKIDTPGTICRKTLYRLVFPYCIGSILFGGFNLMTGGGLLKCLSNISCGRGNGALWFLYAVAIVQLVMALGVWMKDRFPRLVILTVASLFVLGIASPIRCEVWILFYWGCGFLLSRASSLMPKGWIGLVGFTAFMYYGHPWYTKLGWQTIGLALCTLMVLNSAAEVFANRRGVGWLSTLGRHTMVILIFHPLFNTIFRIAQRPILVIDHSGIVFFVLSASFSIGGCLLLELMLKRFRIGFIFGLR